jgi:uncharacterized membrane protein YadS
MSKKLIIKRLVLWGLSVFITISVLLSFLLGDVKDALVLGVGSAICGSIILSWVVYPWGDK